ncbi:hypothetical protein PIB30_085384 [Stylosanthes scabra]|uniref:Uncharacterized protein n=1 Tax=Stylosanthes scabra TaxID=79078 RepID=A0ABU6QSX6_9FABA|nr:hypothetical protein [Stylosanthes scabra]
MMHTHQVVNEQFSDGGENSDEHEEGHVVGGFGGKEGDGNDITVFPVHKATRQSGTPLTRQLKCDACVALTCDDSLFENCLCCNQGVGAAVGLGCVIGGAEGQRRRVPNSATIDLGDEDDDSLVNEEMAAKMEQIGAETGVEDPIPTPEGVRQSD